MECFQCKVQRLHGCLDPAAYPAQGIAPQQLPQVAGAQLDSVVHRLGQALHGNVQSGRHFVPAPVRDPVEDVLPERYGDFGRDGRRGCPMGGHEIADRKVGLMPDRTNNRDRTVEHRPGQALLVEGPKVFQAAAASAHDDQVDCTE